MIEVCDALGAAYRPIEFSAHHHHPSTAAPIVQADDLNEVLNDFAQLAALDERERAAWFERACELTLDGVGDAERVLEAVERALDRRAAEDEASRDAAELVERGEALLFESLARTLESHAEAARQSATLAVRLAGLYRRMSGASPSRHWLLRGLAAYGQQNELALFAELIVADPPARAHDAVMALVPLFQRRDWPVQAVFPRLLDALEYLTLSAAILDLANYQVRRAAVSVHPAAERSERLIALLGSLADQIERIEERPTAAGRSQQETARLVAECVALVIALVDALALIGDTRAEGKLRRLLEVSHRRVRVEAAAALARLRVEAGIEALAHMTADPAVRLRAIGYLEELSLADRVPPEDATAEARAEAELAAWLALPTQFGLAPASVEHLATRRAAWPGFSELVDCHLIRFEYRHGERSFTGVGITGPVTHAIRVEFEDLLADDIVAIYAGWHVEHPDIGEIDAESLAGEQRAMWRQAARRLAEAGYSDIELDRQGRFFGERHWVATAEHDGQRVALVVVDDRPDPWRFALRAERANATGVSEAYCLYKGRRLFEAFDQTQSGERA